MDQVFKGLTDENKKPAPNWQHVERMKEGREARYCAEVDRHSELSHQSTVGVCIYCGAPLFKGVPSGHGGPLCTACY